MKSIRKPTMRRKNQGNLTGCGVALAFMFGCTAANFEDRASTAQKTVKTGESNPEIDGNPSSGAPSGADASKTSTSTSTNTSTNGNGDLNSGSGNNSSLNVPTPTNSSQDGSSSQNNLPPCAQNPAIGSFKADNVEGVQWSAGLNTAVLPVITLSTKSQELSLVWTTPAVDTTTIIYRRDKTVSGQYLDTKIVYQQREGNVKIAPLKEGFAAAGITAVFKNVRTNQCYSRGVIVVSAQ